jgi:hypothetical protein
MLMGRRNKQKNKQTCVFEEVIDTFMLKITIFTHTSFFENSSSKLLSGAQNCFYLLVVRKFFWGSFGGTSLRKGWEPLR